MSSHNFPFLPDMSNTFEPVDEEIVSPEAAARKGGAAARRGGAAARRGGAAARRGGTAARRGQTPGGSALDLAAVDFAAVLASNRPVLAMFNSQGQLHYDSSSQTTSNGNAPHVLMFDSDVQVNVGSTNPFSQNRARAARPLPAAQPTAQPIPYSMSGPQFDASFPAFSSSAPPQQPNVYSGAEASWSTMEPAMSYQQLNLSTKPEPMWGQTKNKASYQPPDVLSGLGTAWDATGNAAFYQQSDLSPGPGTSWGKAGSAPSYQVPTFDVSNSCDHNLGICTGFCASFL
ncbi:uncharacterized protein BDZ99DRAFT_570027 [Mytilinidion resinicola]|uniref:Uncharacterized protein n=1 Tax=Mytilinidion resinicola TaxID=574789 RepID=A0A6A6YS10_9PEZI|nr:uncharacterized protein BDZ99DRAFT_570027 [Mytilinidion resinicola]KAF2810697.1 hypothetical protein BDZ99DRAFT_570027 [Mytilinidion resinicola]